MGGIAAYEHTVMPTPINERKEYMTQRIVVKKADLAILKRWIAAESDHSSDEMRAAVKRLSACLSEDEVLAVWTVEDVQMSYESIRDGYLDDYESTQGRSELPPPSWESLIHAQRESLVSAGRLVLDDTQHISEALMDAIGEAVEAQQHRRGGDTTTVSDTTSHRFSSEG